MKIGIGYDIHRFECGRKLFLGGIEIPCEKGLLGHSDADVLIHAICDAILGAIGEGDIGTHFPDTDPIYKGISSVKLLEQVKELADDKGYTVGNVDCVIIAEEPKIGPYRDKMRESISGILGIEKAFVSVKGKTNEKLGEIGEGRAISAQAVVLMIEGLRV